MNARRKLLVAISAGLLAIAAAARGRGEKEQEMNDLGTTTEQGTVRLERPLPGPIERVWAYLTAAGMTCAK